MEKQNIIITILAVLLIVATGYITYEFYKDRQLEKQQEQISILNQGFNIGYERAITQIMEQLSSCQPVPIYANNMTKQVISTDCLRQA